MHVQARKYINMISILSNKYDQYVNMIHIKVKKYHQMIGMYSTTNILFLTNQYDQYNKQQK